MTTLSRRGFLGGAAAAAAALTWFGCRRSEKAATVREVQDVVPAAPSRDGAGVSLRRSIGSRALDHLDPFLLLDEIHSSDPADYAAGFPRHPHRGFETVSYVLRGGFEHQDTIGNRGIVADGGVQWMTAGHGIVHQEMPVATQGPELWGLQLWVNLPAAHKLMKPRYQNLGAAAVPELDVGEARVRVVAGTVGGVRGPVDGVDIRPTMLDATLQPGAGFVHELPGDDTAFLYVLAGSIAVGARVVEHGELAVLGPGTSIAAAAGSGGGRLLLISGTPLREPIARRGPFVMSTQAELDQAIADYQSGHLTDMI